MKILFVGPRGSDPETVATAAELAQLVETAAGLGHAVALLQPKIAGVDVRRPAAGVCEFVTTREPPFRAVVDRLVDIPTERALSAWLRTERPDVVHVHGFGGRSSYLSPWLGERLGHPVVLVAPSERLLWCHRGSLVHASGEACAVIDDPLRCTRCCRAGDRQALGRMGAIFAWLTKPLRGLGPYPTLAAFSNRLDMIVHGLSTADVVCVPDPVTMERLVRLGVPARGLRSSIAAPNSAEWDDVWRQAIARHAG